MSAHSLSWRSSALLRGVCLPVLVRAAPRRYLILWERVIKWMNEVEQMSDRHARAQLQAAGEFDLAADKSFMIGNRSAIISSQERRIQDLEMGRV